MKMPQENVVHCHACDKYIKLSDSVQEGDIVACPFCYSKNRVQVVAVYVGQPVEEA